MLGVAGLPLLEDYLELAPTRGSVAQQLRSRRLPLALSCLSPFQSQNPQLASLENPPIPWGANRAQTIFTNECSCIAWAPYDTDTIEQPSPANGGALSCVMCQ